MITNSLFDLLMEIGSSWDLLGFQTPNAGLHIFSIEEIECCGHELSHGERKLPQAYGPHLTTSFTPQTANAHPPGGKMCTQTKNKSKRLNHCVNLFEFRLSALRVSSCLPVWGLRGLLAYRVCTPIVFHTLLFYTSIKASLLSWNPPVMSLLCYSQMPMFLPDNSIGTPAKKNCKCAHRKKSWETWTKK